MTRVYRECIPEGKCLAPNVTYDIYGTTVLLLMFLNIYNT